MGIKRISFAALGVGALVCASIAMAAPASAKNVCGPLGVYRDGALAATGHVVQTCDKGTLAVYTVRCLGGTTTFTRHYAAALTATTNISCAGGAGPIFSVGVDYR